MNVSDRIQAFSLRFRWLNVSRMRAFTSHLCLSALIVSSVFAVVFLLWYPRPWFEAIGAWSIIRILIGVDLVLGPLLTLIVFKPGKRLLILDMSFIAVVQLSALIYGLTVLYQERPYYVVYAIDRFHILAEKDIPEDARMLHDWMSKPTIGPVLASARRPTDVDEVQQLLEETVFSGGPDIEQRPKYWVPFQDDLERLRRSAHSLATLRSAGDSAKRYVDDVLADVGISAADLGFFPIMSAKNDASAIVSLDSGEVLAVVPIDPWAAIGPAKP